MESLKLARRRRKLLKQGDDLPEPLRTAMQTKKGEALFMLHTDITFAIVMFCALPMFVAVYFLTTQVWEVTDTIWHWLVPDNVIRHYIRDVGEFYAATFVAGAVVFNRYYYMSKIKNDPTRWDRLKWALHIPSMKDKKPLSLGQFAWTVFWCLMFGAPVFFAGMYFNGYVLANAAAHPWWAEVLNPAPKQPSTDFWVNALRLFTVSWPNKLLGFLLARATMWVARAFFLDVQEYFVVKLLKHRWCDPESGERKPLPRYYPYGPRARYNQLSVRPEYADPPPGKRAVFWLWVVLGLGAVLTVYGWWLYYFHIPELLLAKEAGG